MTTIISIIQASAPNLPNNDPLSASEIRVFQAARGVLGNKLLTFPGISEHVLRNEEARIRLAKLCVLENAEETSLHIRDFEIESDKARLELAKLCIQQRVWDSLRNIRNFWLDERMRIELAIYCVQKNGARTAENIADFCIYDEGARIEIAKLCAKQTLWGIERYISRFAIRNEKGRIEIAKFCAERDYQIKDIIDNFEIKDQCELQKIRLICCFQWASIIGDDDQLFNFGRYLQEHISDKKILALIEKTMDDKSCWQKKLPLLLSYLGEWYYVVKTQKEMSEKDQTILLNLCKYRNRSIASSLAKTFCDIAPNPFLIECSSFLKQPMVPICKWGDNTKPIVGFLQHSRLTIKNANTGFLQRWLFTAIAVDQSPLSPQRKLALFLQVTEKEDHLAERLSAISALSSLNPTCLDRDLSKDPTQELLNLVEKALTQDDFIDLNNIPAFSEKYVKTWGSTRVPLAWLTYMGGLKILEDQAVRAEFECMVRSVLNGSYLKERYRTDLSPHLKHLEKIAPELFLAWQQDPRVQEISLESQSKKNNPLELVDTNDWQDLFLSGTEVLGSCQRVDSPPHNSKCLLATVMDGKNRMLAIKEKETGKITARALFRLLLDEKGNPVLFLDRMYPTNCTSAERSALIEFAKARAKALGCPLLTKEKNAGDSYTGSIYSLGSRSPYEYEDAAEGVMPGGKFKISGLKLLSSEEKREEKEEKKL